MRGKEYRFSAFPASSLPSPPHARHPFKRKNVKYTGMLIDLGPTRH